MSSGSGAVRSTSRSVRGCRNSQAMGVEGLAIDQDVGLGRIARPPAESFGLDHVAQRDAVAPRVELVGQDRMADVGEMDADLVGPAGLRLAPHQGEAAEPLDDFVERHRRLAAVRGGADGHLLADGRMEADRLLDVVAVALRDAVDQRQIFLVDLAQLELERRAGDGPARP